MHAYLSMEIVDKKKGCAEGGVEWTQNFASLRIRDKPLC